MGLAFKANNVRILWIGCKRQPQKHALRGQVPLKRLVMCSSSLIVVVSYDKIIYLLNVR